MKNIEPHYQSNLTLNTILSFIFLQILLLFWLFSHLSQIKYSLHGNAHDSITIIYATCFEKNNFSASFFEYPTYKVSCNETKSIRKFECKESVPYLQFLYNNYYNLTGKLIFIHGHEKSWHYKTSVYEAVKKRIQSPEFKSSSYGGIFSHYFHRHVPWKKRINDTNTYEKIFQYIYHNTSMMQFYGLQSTKFPCCSTFFVDADCIRLRPRNEYLTIIERLINYSHHFPHASYHCSRLMEYTWHVLLGNMTKVTTSGLI